MKSSTSYISTRIRADELMIPLYEITNKWSLQDYLNISNGRNNDFSNLTSAKCQTWLSNKNMESVQRTHLSIRPSEYQWLHDASQRFASSDGMKSVITLRPIANVEDLSFFELHKNIIIKIIAI